MDAQDVLVQVARPILRLNPLERAEQPGLQLPEHAREVRRPRVSPFRCADDPHAVLVAGKSRVQVSAPAICSAPRPGLAVPSTERAEALRTSGLDRREAYPAGPRSGTPVILLLQENVDRASHQGRGRGSRTPPTRLAVRGSTDRRFVRLDQPGQTRAVCGEHAPAQSRQKRPRGAVIADPTWSLAWACADSWRMRGHEVGRPKPLLPRNVRARQERARERRRLTPA